MRWLGHVARMDNARVPKQVNFGEVTATRPQHGPRKRWRDVVREDLTALEVEQDWYSLAQDRHQWRQLTQRHNPASITPLSSLPMCMWTIFPSSG